MRTLTKTLLFLCLAVTILPFLHVGIGIGMAAIARHSSCGPSAFSLNGDVYCRPVQAIKYENVSLEGVYRRIVGFTDRRECYSACMGYHDLLAPFNEELSLHLHGPLHLSRLAIFVPPPSTGIVVNPYAYTPRPPPVHTAYVPSPGHILEQLMGDVSTGDVVVDGTQKKVVVYKNYMDLGLVPRLSDGRKPAKEVRWEEKSVFEKMVRWVRERIPREVDSFFRSEELEDEDAERCPSYNDPSVYYAKTPLGPPIIEAPYERLSYYSAAAETADNLVFMGHHDLPDEHRNRLDSYFGSSLKYLSADGTEGSASPHVLADAVIPSRAEVVIMQDRKCNRDCGYIRARDAGYHGFGGGEKVFLIEFSMPVDEKPGFDGDMPAITLLNAQIPRTSQYGPAECSCLASGCGEFTILQTLSRGSLFLRSALHAGRLNSRGGSPTDYIARPTESAIPMKLAIVFEARAESIEILVLPTDTPFPAALSQEILDSWREVVGKNVSTFDVGGGAVNKKKRAIKKKKKVEEEMCQG